jgi:hypothetical protein
MMMLVQHEDIQHIQLTLSSPAGASVAADAAEAAPGDLPPPPCSAGAWAIARGGLMYPALNQSPDVCACAHAAAFTPPPSWSRAAVARHPFVDLCYLCQRRRAQLVARIKYRSLCTKVYALPINSASCRGVGVGCDCFTSDLLLLKCACNDLPGTSRRRPRQHVSLLGSHEEAAQPRGVISFVSVCDMLFVWGKG